MAGANALLTSLSANDFAALNPFFKTVRLQSHQVLADRGELISQIYFPTTCVVSLVVTLSSGETIEAAMVGRNGVVGGAAALWRKCSESGEPA